MGHLWYTNFWGADPFPPPLPHPLFHYTASAPPPQGARQQPSANGLLGVLASPRPLPLCSWSRSPGCQSANGFLDILAFPRTGGRGEFRRG